MNLLRPWKPSDAGPPSRGRDVDRARFGRDFELFAGANRFPLPRHSVEEVTMRRDMQRFMMLELIAVIAALAVVFAITVLTLLPG